METEKKDTTTFFDSERNAFRRRILNPSQSDIGRAKAGRVETFCLDRIFKLDV